MSPERIAGIIRAKRRQHPELRRPLRWIGLKRILAREYIGLFMVPMPAHQNAQLVPYLGSWSILLNSALPPRRHTYFAAHELGHLWLHHDLHFDRWEQVYHMTREWEEDPREDDAELFASMVLGRYL